MTAVNPSTGLSAYLRCRSHYIAGHSDCLFLASDWAARFCGVSPAEAWRGYKDTDDAAKKFARAWRDGDHFLSLVRQQFDPHFHQWQPGEPVGAGDIAIIQDNSKRPPIQLGIVVGRGERLVIPCHNRRGYRIHSISQSIGGYKCHQQRG